MSGKCENCNIQYIQFQATCLKDNNGIYQTKRYYRCPKCDTVYVEVDAPQDEHHSPGVICVEKHPPIKKEKSTLDKWM